MTLRPSNPSDLPAILTIHAHSLPLHTHAIFTNPFRHLHPASYTAYTSTSPTNKLLSPSPHVYNLTITTNPQNTPTSWAFWRRNLNPHLTPPSPSPSPTPSLIPTNTQELEKYPSLSLPRLHLCTLHSLTDARTHFSSPHYYLSHLLVHPDHKRKGYGTLLTLWGLYHAAKDGVPVYLVASTEGEGLYKKLGFRVIGEKSYPSIDEMSEEDRRREEEVLGKEVVEEQFRIVRPKIMVWEGTLEDEMFKDKEVMDKILAVPWDVQDV
ncbi:hypothetical protein TWF506_008136 [Arthrobotrys conoides]|uniref:N-acetyltransferase domain-containing protein n=1 Tax=Arthrobotrys conoides TaxID=74498 RepID=A0AAN8NIN3_9PEZI